MTDKKDIIPPEYLIDLFERANFPIDGITVGIDQEWFEEFLLDCYCRLIQKGYIEEPLYSKELLVKIKQIIYNKEAETAEEVWELAREFYLDMKGKKKKPGEEGTGSLYPETDSQKEDTEDEEDLPIPPVKRIHKWMNEYKVTGVIKIGKHALGKIIEDYLDFSRGIDKLSRYYRKKVRPDLSFFYFFAKNSDYPMNDLENGITEMYVGFGSSQKNRMKLLRILYKAKRALNPQEIDEQSDKTITNIGGNLARMTKAGYLSYFTDGRAKYYALRGEGKKTSATKRLLREQRKREKKNRVTKVNLKTNTNRMKHMKERIKLTGIHSSKICSCGIMSNQIIHKKCLVNYGPAKNYFKNVILQECDKCNLMWINKETWEEAKQKKRVT